MEWIVLGLVAVLLIWGIRIYNRLIKLRNRVATAWSDIDVQLTRRHELVPNLVEIVSAYTDHERETLAQVTQLRTEAVGTQSPARLGAIENELEQLLSRLMLLKEDYPDLKASDNYAQLTDKLVEVEDHLVYARRYYNGAVRDLNIAIGQFPDLLVARPLNFTEAEFYSAEDSHRSAPGTGGLA